MQESTTDRRLALIGVKETLTAVPNPVDLAKKAGADTSRDVHTARPNYAQSAGHEPTFRAAARATLRWPQAETKSGVSAKKAALGGSLAIKLAGEREVEVLFGVPERRQTFRSPAHWLKQQLGVQSPIRLGRCAGSVVTMRGGVVPGAEGKDNHCQSSSLFQATIGTWRGGIAIASERHPVLPGRLVHHQVEIAIGDTGRRTVRRKHARPKRRRASTCGRSARPGGPAFEAARVNSEIHRLDGAEAGRNRLCRRSPISWHRR